MWFPKKEPTRTDISYEGPEKNNGKYSQYIDFRITNLDGNAYDRNETIATNSVRSSCKRCFEEFSSESELLEHLQRSFKFAINNTQSVVLTKLTVLVVTTITHATKD